MAEEASITGSPTPDDGIAPFRVDTWAGFHQLIENEIFQDEHSIRRYIWRGQRRSDWTLQSSLDRLFDRIGVEPRVAEQRAKRHLEEFVYASRGRRGVSPPGLLENEWWALGQ